ncbi:MAG: hypothetical protein J6C40_01790 [Lentisphaeria bacterium]|nr:hypothetical protein [Lentisphaeria bacterium]
MDDLLNSLLTFYKPQEFPALYQQMKRYSESKPFCGLKILDGTPVFRNTLAKYLPLLAGGADLTVAFGENIPHAPGIEKELERFHIPLADAEMLKQEYDVVMDCAGALRHTPARLGRVELTRSGIYYYADADQPVFLADGGKIKHIETALGTGDGFHRAMCRLGYGELRGKKIVVFGCGKVGRGVAMYALWHGAETVVADLPEKVTPPKGARLIDFRNREELEKELSDAWCMVSATGIRHALRGCFDAEKVCNSSILIANMGVEDEFGTEIPAERVLHNKIPLNFILEEPTHIKFIDPTMALSNYGALKLLRSTLPAGIVYPDDADENPILEDVRRYGMIAEELTKMEMMQ